MLGTRRAIRTFAAVAALLIGLMGARLEFAVFATRFARGARVERLRFAGLAGTSVGRTHVGGAGFGRTAFAIIATTFFRAEGRTIFASLRLGGAVARGGGRSFPIHGGTFLAALGREDVERRLRSGSGGGTVERKQLVGRSGFLGNGSRRDGGGCG